MANDCRITGKHFKNDWYFSMLGAVNVVVLTDSGELNKTGCFSGHTSVLYLALKMFGYFWINELNQMNLQMKWQVKLGASDCKSKAKRVTIWNNSLHQKESANLHKAIESDMLHKKILCNFLGKQQINHYLCNHPCLLFQMQVFDFNKVFCALKS